jgi:hypothetical protein
LQRPFEVTSWNFDSNETVLTSQGSCKSPRRELGSVFLKSSVDELNSFICQLYIESSYAVKRLSEKLSVKAFKLLVAGIETSLKLSKEIVYKHIKIRSLFSLDTHIVVQS